MYQHMFMKRLKMMLFKIAPLVFLFTWSSFSASILKSGAELGKWSMDFDAAIKLAEKHNLAIFLNFTGSDWCGWCKLMDRSVFSDVEWSKFAKEKLSLVTIDFPQDPTIVPAHFKDRNLKLQERFGIMGYPTYVLLESDGETELGRLGANQDKSVKRFKQEILEIIKYSKGQVETYTKEFSPERAAEYKRLVDQLNKIKSEFGNWLQSQPQESEENFAKFTNYLSQLNEVSIKIDTIEAEKFSKGLSQDKAKEYLALTAKLNQHRMEMDEWLQSHPEANEINRQKKENLESKIKQLTKQINQF